MLKEPWDLNHQESHVCTGTCLFLDCFYGSVSRYEKPNKNGITEGRIDG